MEQLREDPKVLLWHEEQDWGFALLGLESQEELDHYAALAHQDAGCGRIERVSLGQNLTPLAGLAAPVYSSAVKLPTVESLVKDVDQSRMVATIQSLVAIGTRYHASASGTEAAETVRRLFSTEGEGLGQWSVRLETHQHTAQPSVVAELQGVADDKVAVVLGAHIDSINRGNLSQAPGADDDASGVATLVEVVRLVRSKGLVFKRRVEFHGYAAEEVGLVGSRELAAKYAAEGRTVAAMMQFDMNAYSMKADDRTIHLVTDATSLELRRALKFLIRSYTDADYAEGTLPQGAVSDHKAWYDQGFNTVFPFENPKSYSPHLHSTADTVANANNLGLSARMAQVAVAFLIHYAGLVDAEDAYTAARATHLPPELDMKLNLAIQAASSPNTYHVTVAAPPETHTVEMCALREGSDDDCQAERINLQGSGTQEGRQRLFFASKEPLSLAVGQRWRFHAYGSDDQLLGFRQVELLGTTVAR
jgi:leucyl aminopeptidase